MLLHLYDNIIQYIVMVMFIILWIEYLYSLFSLVIVYWSQYNLVNILPSCGYFGYCTILFCVPSHLWCISSSFTICLYWDKQPSLSQGHMLICSPRGTYYHVLTCKYRLFNRLLYPVVCCNLRHSIKVFVDEKWHLVSSTIWWRLSTGMVSAYMARHRGLSKG